MLCPFFMYVLRLEGRSGRCDGWASRRRCTSSRSCFLPSSTPAPKLPRSLPCTTVRPPHPASCLPNPPPRPLPTCNALPCLETTMMLLFKHPCPSRLITTPLQLLSCHLSRGANVCVACRTYCEQASFSATIGGRPGRSDSALPALHFPAAAVQLRPAQRPLATCRLLLPGGGRGAAQQCPRPELSECLCSDSDRRYGGEVPRRPVDSVTRRLLNRKHAADRSTRGYKVYAPLHPLVRPSSRAARAVWAHSWHGGGSCGGSVPPGFVHTRAPRRRRVRSCCLKRSRPAGQHATVVPSWGDSSSSGRTVNHTQDPWPRSVSSHSRTGSSGDRSPNPARK